VLFVDSHWLPFLMNLGSVLNSPHSFSVSVSKHSEFFRLADQPSSTASVAITNKHSIRWVAYAYAVAFCSSSSSHAFSIQNSELRVAGSVSVLQPSLTQFVLCVAHCLGSGPSYQRYVFYEMSVWA
jgi:hypothetical protein